MKPQLLFGTNNSHKLAEIKGILGEMYEILSLKDVGKEIDVAETEPSLEGNAILKAKAFFHHTGIPCFADDTGLEVDALKGAPGVFSARYAGENCSYQDNVDKLLREMTGKDDRKAAFRTVIAYFDGTQTLTFEGKIGGIIIQQQQGNGGFGYDPVFLPDGHEQSFAEMPATLKNQISHRALAVRKFADFMKRNRGIEV